MVFLIDYITGPPPALVETTDWVCPRGYSHREAFDAFRDRYPQAVVLAVRREQEDVA